MSRPIGVEGPDESLSFCRGPILEFSAAGGCHRPFEERAAHAPEAVAVALGNTKVSYGELNRRANTLAQQLRALGAGSGRRVGLHLNRSPEMVIALLAVLKSGAAYVPLDPAFPRKQLQAVLHDAAPIAVVTRQQLSRTLPSSDASLLEIDGEERASHAGFDNPPIPIAAADPAYVMYTSGSTGEPKGVEITHGAVSNHLAWRRSYFPLEPQDRSLQTASLSFDDSVWEILEPLSAGACIVLAKPWFEQESAYLVELIARQRITVAASCLRCCARSSKSLALVRADHCGGSRPEGRSFRSHCSGRCSRGCRQRASTTATG